MMSKYLPLIILFFLYSCAETPTKFERNNLNDPDNPAYNLAPASAFDSEILPDKLIKLTWDNSSEYQLATAIIFTKTLEAETNAITLDTLDADKSTFVDSSQQVRYNTLYHLTRIRETENDIIKSEVLHTDIDFGGMINKSANICCTHGYTDTTGTNINPDSLKAYFSWNFETAWPFISVAYEIFDETKQPIPVDTLQAGEKSYESPVFDLDFKERRFIILSYIVEDDITNENIADSLTVTYKPSNLMKPEIDEPDVRHESKTIITWSDNSLFEDGFEVLRGYNRNYQSVIGTVGPNVTTFTDTLQPFLPQTGISGGLYYRDYNTFYSIRAIKNNTALNSDTLKGSIRIYTADLWVSSSDENSITLKWELRQPSDINSFILLRSTDGDNFIPYQTLGIDQNSYRDINLDTSETYHYRIKSEIKNGFGRPNLSYSYVFSELASFDYKNASILEVSKNDKYLVAASGYDSESSSNQNEVVIYDLGTNTEVYRINPFNKPVDGIDILEEKNLIAFASKNAGMFEVRNFMADTTVFSISNIEVHDIEFAPDGSSVYIVSELSNFKKYSLGSPEPEFEIQSTEQFHTFPAKRRITVSSTGDSIAVNMASKYQLYTDQGERINFNSLSTQGNTSDWVNISNTGKFIASTREFANTTITHLQSLNTGAELFHLGGMNSSLDFSYDDHLALVTTKNDVYLIDMKTHNFAGTHHFTSNWPDEGITFSRISNTDYSFFIANSQGIKKMIISNTRKWQPAAYTPTISPYY